MYIFLYFEYTRNGDRMKLKTKFIIIGVVIFLLNFPLHFLYDVFPNFFTSLISPVNESLFEHLKMIFTSFWMGAIIFYFFNKEEGFFNILFSFLIAAYVCIGFYLLIYIPINMAFGENMLVTISLLFVAIMASQIVSYYILNLKKIKYQNWISIGILIITYILIYFLTYNTPKLPFFEDQETSEYGLTESS